ncbi:G-protein coupled receptor 3 isoform X1 [Taeniopygia guttata]|uniref:G-protein coupled receptor 3 isoform X1 n=1 Tax=Taeniopygia guttata TaxID=59729 RepID=UPI003BB8E6C4
MRRARSRAAPRALIGSGAALTSRRGERAGGAVSHRGPGPPRPPPARRYNGGAHGSGARYPGRGVSECPASRQVTLRHHDGERAPQLQRRPARLVLSRERQWQLLGSGVCGATPHLEPVGRRPLHLGDHHLLRERHRGGGHFLHPGFPRPHVPPDRQLGHSRPPGSALTYCSERTVTRTYIMLLLAWGASICHGLLPVMGWNCLGEPWACSIVRPLTRSHLRLLSASVLAVFVAMLQLYVQICRIVCRHAQQIAVQRHCPASSQHLSTHKGIATLAVVLGTFGCCWLPLAVYGLLGDGSSPALYTYATLLSATSNSLLNPLIYAFRNQEIQKVLLGAVCCACLSSPLPFRSPSDV